MRAMRARQLFRQVNYSSKRLMDAHDPPDFVPYVVRPRMRRICLRLQALVLNGGQNI